MDDHANAVLGAFSVGAMLVIRAVIEGDVPDATEWKGSRWTELSSSCASCQAIGSRSMTGGKGGL